MAILSDQIWLEFGGGLNTSVHESQIGENELSECENAIVRDGRARLDRRYAGVCTKEGAEACTGSGYGKYGSGEQSEQYAAVLDGDLHLIDLTQGELAFTPVIGAGGLAGGQWFFEQFEDHLYGINEIAGLGRKKLFPGDDGTGDWSGVKRPRRPTQQAALALYTPQGIQADFTGSTITNTGLVSAVFAGGILTCHSSGVGEKSVTITLDDAPDLSLALQYRDVCELSFVIGGSQDAGFKVFIETSLNVEYEMIKWYAPPNQTGNLAYYRLQNINRPGRIKVTGLRISWTQALAGDVYVYLNQPHFYGVWLSLPSSYNPGASFPVFESLVYTYTYFNADTGLESKPALNSVFPASGQHPWGNWMNVTVYGSAEDGVTAIRVYRVIASGGAISYYRLAELQNVNQVYLDKLPVDEVEALPRFKPGEIPDAGGGTAIASWQRRLWIAVGSLIYGSREDDPLSFDPIEGPVDPFDEGNGLTFYCDDKKAERVHGLGSANALYVVTDRSVRALFGNSPLNWRYERLPESEGACGSRAWCVYRDGVLVLTPSGRLLYCALGAGPAQDVAEKLRERIGALGMKELASAGAVVAVRPDGQIEVRSESGRYAVLDWTGAWRRGKHTHPTHSALFVSGLPLRWMGLNATLYEGDLDAYDTDDGVEVLWSVASRKYRLPRMQVDNVFLGDSSQSLGDVGGQTGVLFPRVEVVGPRGATELKAKQGRRNVRASVKDTGEAFLFRITGDKDTVVEECRVGLKKRSAARQT